MNEFEKIRTWNALKEMLRKIHDYKTRNIYYKALLARACAEWGFNPEKPGQQVPTQNIKLDDWEKEFVEDINDSITFGFNVRKQKQSRMFVETRRNMRDFVRHGGTLKDIPDDIRTPFIVDLYVQELIFNGEELLELADSVIKG